MKAPKIQLKNVQTFEGHDGIGLNADVWIDGVKCMHIHDGAYGGCMEYHNFTYDNPKAEQIKVLIKNFEDYIKTLPARTYIMGGETHSMKMDMDLFITELQERMELEKKMKKSILVGVPNATQYGMYKFKVALSNIPTQQLQAAIGRIKLKLEKGEQILNTNLQELGVTV